jgi:hypothetical protein
MSTSIGQSIDALCKEHGIDRDLVVEAMKEAVRAAARKQFKSGEEIAVEWSSESGIELFASKVVVEEVTNPGREMSLAEAQEWATEEGGKRGWRVDLGALTPLMQSVPTRPAMVRCVPAASTGARLPAARGTPSA